MDEGMFGDRDAGDTGIGDTSRADLRENVGGSNGDCGVEVLLEVIRRKLRERNGESGEVGSG